MQIHPTINASTTGEVFVTPALFDRIVQSAQNLVAIRTANAEDVIAQFRLLALRTGQSVYYWQEDAGIASLRDRDVRVPGSKRASDALRYILQSPQFGIYLFTDFAEHLRPPNTGLLRQIARSRSVAGRKIVFVGDAIEMPEGMDVLVEAISHQAADGARPRLRDGRWVV
ncbi:MAG: hypothetical protein JSR27_06130 [Proteobacteria bacterium]|nr:hypothetical protein [Pseudomonadota bacterium]